MTGDGEDYRGCLFSLPLAFVRQTAAVGVQGDVSVELFYLVVHCVQCGFCGGFGCLDVVNDNLYNLDLFLDAVAASRSWWTVAVHCVMHCRRWSEVVLETVMSYTSWLGVQLTSALRALARTKLMELFRTGIK